MVKLNTFHVSLILHITNGFVLGSLYTLISQFINPITNFIVIYLSPLMILVTIGGELLERKFLRRFVYPTLFGEYDWEITKRESIYVIIGGIVSFYVAFIILYIMIRIISVSIISLAASAIINTIITISLHANMSDDIKVIW